MSPSPDYLRVWLTFMQNGLVREMTFRGNFFINVITRAFWFAAQITLFEIIYSNVDAIRGWSREQYFALMATMTIQDGVHVKVEAMGPFSFEETRAGDPSKGKVRENEFGSTGADFRAISRFHYQWDVQHWLVMM